VRIFSALRPSYGYYDAGEAMIANTIRDADEVEPLQAIVAAFGGYLGLAADDLARAFGARRRARKRGRAAAGHAVSFTTWRSLVREQGVTGRDAGELMVALLADTNAR
jgi:hypothetical protein